MNKHAWIEPVGISDLRKIYTITTEGSTILKIERERISHILSLYEGKMIIGPDNGILCKTEKSSILLEYYLTFHNKYLTVK
ncbi:hypothetical protein J1TS3_03220 [Siminovitchia fordii]|uniref:Uncharacterized protein n=1 Tax=Siminovitchia fordii TaxID=254759 RepID=A0ABQ4K272_9BACI|nr:hypothetical protein J1TS3_03220 [Siminovitchia fordii]